jgi:hypothetical protein
MKCNHANPSCGCTSKTWVWYDCARSFVFLENPKAASTYIKEKVLEEGVEIPRLEIPPDVKIFGICRDPVDKMVSIFKDFTKSGKSHRLERMANIFSCGVVEVERLSFEQFLVLAGKYRDHHWDSNFRFLFVPNRKASLFMYHPGVMREIENFLHIKIGGLQVNTSNNYAVEVTKDHLLLIREILKEDYENYKYFEERVVNADRSVPFWSRQGV